MNFFFFGSGDRQLFGAYHPSRPGTPERGAALLCPPWGPEYIASHRILRRLALMLSENGYNVLRFDYFGTGDSSGARDEGDLDSWYEDAGLAVDELRDMSGATSVTVFGVRLGAHVGWRLAVDRDDINAIVMWDPVIDGEQYLKALVSAQLEIDRWWLSPHNGRRSIDLGKHETIDLLGFPLTDGMRRSIEAIKLADYQRATNARAFVFYSRVDPDEASLRGSFASAGTAVMSETMVGQTPWRDDESVIAGDLPFAMLERMVEVVA